MLNHTLKLDLGTDRHLVVGDLHGRYDQFMRLLEIANYDPSSDVLYSVGDLIDRGPKSVECVEFFLGERRYAIKGNHEAMMLDSEYFSTWISNGGTACLNSLSDHDRDIAWLCDLVRPLPWVIDVGENEEEDAFRIIHAEFPPGWPEDYFQNMLSYALNADDPAFARCIWSRKLITAASANLAQGFPADRGIQFNGRRFRTVFTGHTPCTHAFQCGDHWFLDTWRGHHLTLMDAITKETFRVDIAWTAG